MSGTPDLTGAILGLVLAAWMAAAVWAIWTGLNLQRRAKAELRQSGRLGRLLETSPALPLLIRSDGKLEASQRLMHWFGFEHQPTHITDLNNGQEGIALADLEALTQDVKLAQKSGAAFVRPVRVQGSDRTLLIKGGLADQKISPNGGALLWVFDATDSENQIEKLRDGKEQAERAFESLTAVIEAAPLPMWFRDSEGKLALVNSAYVQAVKASNPEVVVERQIELIEESERLDGSALGRKEGESINRQIPVTIGDNRRLMNIVNVSLGSVGDAGYAIDMEDIRQARAEIERSVNAQRDMLDRMSSAVAQFGADKTLTFYNVPFQRLFSLRQQWLSDNPEFARLLDRMREMNRTPQVSDFPEWRTEKAGWFRATEPQEEDWLLADGTHLRVLASPTADGGLLLIFEDRTEQVQLASARDTLLRARTATFDNLFESIAVFAADGKLNIWNHSFAGLWDLSEQELAKHPHINSLMQRMARQLKTAAQISNVREAVRSATGERRQRDGRIAFSDGRHFEYAAIPLPDGNAMFTMLDVSDSHKIEHALRERNQALVEADAIKGEFLANMSYEFRTPLTSIGGFAELLESGIAGELSEQGADYVKAILQSTKKLRQQIDNLLDLTQSQAGALPIAKEKANLDVLVRRVVDHHKDEITKKQIDMDLRLEDTLGSANVDNKRIGQALSHIVDNAVRYNRINGRLLVHGSGDVKSVTIHISDDGPGMSVAEQSRVFDGFGRAKKGDAGAKSGGLGLPLARQLIMAHGGEMTLTSEPGEGTVVSIHLPRN